MKKVMKVTSGILAMLMIVGVMCSCGKNDANFNDVTKVSIWRSSGHDKNFMQEKFKEFNDTVGKEKGIELEYVAKEGDMEEMVDLAYTSGQAPDMYSTYKIQARAQKDQIAALEDIEGTEELISKYKDKLLELRHQYEGKTYTLPVSSCTYGLIYNVEMFKEAGLVDQDGNPTPPETWDEVVEYAKKLTNVSEQKYGIIVPAKWSGWYGCDINMAAAAIDGIVDGYDPTTGEYSYDAQAVIMDAYVRMKKDGSVVPGAEGIDNDPARARFGQGNIGMKIAGSYDVGVLTNQFPAKIEWAVAPLPVEKKGEGGMQFSSADGLFCINKDSVEKIGAKNIVAILEFFTSDELLTEMYEQGLAMPTDYELTKNAELGEDMKNWADFASYLEFSQCTPMGVSSDMSGEKSIVDICLGLWNEEADTETIKQTFEEFEEKKNAGIAKYQSIHPEYDPSPFIIKDWKRFR